MQIKAIVSVVPMTNGKFLPKFVLIEPGSDSEQSFDLTEDKACTTEQEAMVHAKWHAEKTAKQQYGEDVQMIFEKRA